jgi:hypothetical protein
LDENKTPILTFMGCKDRTMNSPSLPLLKISFNRVSKCQTPRVKKEKNRSKKG